jgi:ABC-2 type transport system permease protein
MALICGIYSPVSILPPPLPDIAHAIPLTYFLKYFRSLHEFDGKAGELLSRGFGWTGFCLGIEALLLKWAIHHARKNGTFIKLSE